MGQVAIPLIHYLMVLGTAALPVVELKAAIPLGVLSFGMPLWTAFLIAIIGSAIPAPFILVFIRKVIHRLQNSRVKVFNRFSNWLMGKVEKHADKVKRFGYLAVFFFVAIPLPGTGVWTGSLLAAMMDLRVKYALPAIMAGNVVAGLAMIFLTHTITVVV